MSLLAAEARVEIQADRSNQRTNKNSTHCPYMYLHAGLSLRFQVAGQIQQVGGESNG